MSYFYGEMQSTLSKTVRTIRGGADNGIKAHIRSYDFGVWIEISRIANFEVIRVWQTNGSNDATKTKLIATLKKKIDRKEKIKKTDTQERKWIHFAHITN